MNMTNEEIFIESKLYQYYPHLFVNGKLINKDKLPQEAQKMHDFILMGIQWQRKIQEETLTKMMKIMDKHILQIPTGATRNVLCDINIEFYDAILGRDTFVHPEQLPNEVFLINAKDGEDWSRFPKWIESVRYGEVAYSTDGRIVEGYKPLFAVRKK